MLKHDHAYGAYRSLSPSIYLGALPLGLRLPPPDDLSRTARFFITLGLDFRGEGEDDGELETLTISLEINGVIHVTIFSTLTHRNPRRLHCHLRRAEGQASHLVPNPSFLCLRPNLFLS